MRVKQRKHHWETADPDVTRFEMVTSTERHSTARNRHFVRLYCESQMFHEIALELLELDGGGRAQQQ